MKTYIPLLFFAAFCWGCQKTVEISSERLDKIPYTSVEKNQEKNFYLYIPKGYDSDEMKDWPVIMFLHGNGERGNGKEDLGFTMAHGPIYEAWVQRRDLPFIIIGPQLPLYGFDTLGIPYLTNRDITKFPVRLEDGTPPRSPKGESNQLMNGQPALSSYSYGTEGPPMGWNTIEQDLLNILDKVKTEYRVDHSRIYLSGLSYGGFGTWYLASKHPDIFAAINPIVGWGHEDLMEALAEAEMPIWCFAGGRDGAVNVQYFYRGMNRLEELGHKNVRFTVEEDMGHDVWKRVYAGEDIYNWFLKHKKE
ncbi:MAG: prolyl oligopeptidase family serine peptidase [Reichenbachiella sp.]